MLAEENIVEPVFPGEIILLPNSVEIIRLICGSEAYQKRNIISENEALRESSHIHTPDSDGVGDIFDLIVVHFLMGYERMVITEHDYCLGGQYAEEKLRVQEFARALGIELSYGAEISSYMDISFLGLEKKRMGFHMIIRDFDLEDSGIREMFEMLAKSREKRADDILYQTVGNLREDLILPDKFEKQRGVKTTTDVALRVCELNPSLDFEDFLGELLRNPAYQVIQEKVEIFQLLEIVGSAGGHCTLAHPAKTMKENFAYLDPVVGRLAEKGLAGIEVYGRKQNRDQTRELVRIAEKYGLTPRAGADIHKLADMFCFVELMHDFMRN